MDCIGVVFTFEGTLQWPTILIDLGFSEIRVLISDTYGNILVPVILHAGADADLSVQRQIRRVFVRVIHG